jgi:hypothetical protein
VSAVPAGRAELERCEAEVQWAEIASAAPVMAETMRRYLGQLATFLAPTSVEVADASLRIFGRWLVTNTAVVAVADIGRTGRDSLIRPHRDGLKWLHRREVSALL